MSLLYKTKYNTFLIKKIYMFKDTSIFYYLKKIKKKNPTRTYGKKKTITNENVKKG